MSQQELLTDVVTRLQHLGIDFMLSGSHASSLQGEARATHDIDFVIRITPDQVAPLLAGFPEDRFYVSESAAQEAVSQRRMFNVLETNTGEKIDFWILTDSPFDQSRFGRRQRVRLADCEVDVSSPEDTILMKLVWCQRSGGSEKQFQDVLRVYELQGNLLDLDYLAKWLDELGTVDLWKRALREAEPFVPPDSIG